MPMRLSHVRPGEPLTAAGFNALVDALNGLLQLSAASPLQMVRTPAGLHVTTGYAEHEAYVRLSAALSRGGSAAARIQWFDGLSWIDADTDEIVVYDLLGSFEGQPGDHALARFHRQSGRWVLWNLQC